MSGPAFAGRSAFICMAPAEPFEQPASSHSQLISRLDMLGLHLRQLAEDYAQLRIEIVQHLSGTTFKSEAGKITKEGRGRIDRLRSLGFPNIEIAAELGVTPPAITNRVRRAGTAGHGDDKAPPRSPS